LAIPPISVMGTSAHDPFPLALVLLLLLLLLLLLW
jgi:hypothetical protein